MSKQNLISTPERVCIISAELENKISQALAKHNLSLNDVSRISECILRLSDFYISQPASPTPWKEAWAQIAYLTYFLPLNFMRAQAVAHEGHKVGFFEGLTSLVDFGAGLGSGSMAVAEADPQILHHLYIERSKTAQDLHRTLCHESSSQSNSHSNSQRNSEWCSESPTQLSPKTLSIFSYTLTELNELPPWAWNSEALMILEPATREDGRKLLMLRDRLIENGFQIWAPCTHQGLCPLLTQSKTDWCHDRIHFQQPEWFKKIEAHLPMKNTTLTTSYLLARKKKNPAMAAEPSGTSKQARTVGDQVVEKGKTRQLVCRGPEREFLTWMERDWKKGAPRLPRGAVIDWPQDAEKKSNEIRLRP